MKAPVLAFRQQNKPSPPNEDTDTARFIAEIQAMVAELTIRRPHAANVVFKLIDDLLNVTDDDERGA